MKILFFYDSDSWYTVLGNMSLMVHFTLYQILALLIAFPLMTTYCPNWTVTPFLRDKIRMFFSLHLVNCLTFPKLKQSLQ